VPVVLLPSATTLDGAVEKIRAVAAALGVPERGGQIAAQTQTEIDAAQALAAKATSKPRVAFLYVRGAATQQLGGKGTSADSLIAAAGGIDAGSEAGVQGYKPLTPEALVTAQPDVLLLLTAGLESVGGVDGLITLPGVAQTPAGKNRRVLHYDDQYLLGMGPRVGQALMDLVKGLHLELK
jgi:iron complex transport system substrate-binding protein